MASLLSPPPNLTSTLASKSYLTYIVPSSTTFSLESLATAQRETGVSSVKAILGSVEQRESLFFDETITVLLVLKAPVPSNLPGNPQEYLRAALSRVAIALDASVANTSVPGRTTPPSEDFIFNGNVEEGKEPLIIYDENEGDESSEEDENKGEEQVGEGEGRPRQQWAYAAWTIPVFLQRPRMRLQDPSVVLRATATLKPLPDDPAALLLPASSSSSRPASYLTPGRPSSLNLLASLAADPTVASRTTVPPRLSALRVSRVAPMTQARDVEVPLRSLEQIKLTINPAVQTRMRLSRPVGASLPPSRSGIVAVIEVDFTPHSDCEILLDGVDMRVPGATVEDLGAGIPGLAFPLRCVAHDHLTFLYRVIPTDLDMDGDSDPIAGVFRDNHHPVRELNITVKATMQIQPGTCAPQLVMNWSAPLDFTAPVNPGYGPATQPIQRPRRPSQLSIGGSTRDGGVATSLISPSVTRPDSLPALDEAVAAAAARTAEMSIPDLGITVTFTAPSHPVSVGEDFAWTIHVVNRTNERNPNTPPRKLALVALPWRKRADGPRGATRPISRAKKQSGQAPMVDMADAVLDQPSVYAMQRNAQLEPVEVLCLSADTRVGPLLPGACQAVEMRFIALKEGILGVEAIRVIDLGSQEHVDVRELPVMIVEGAKG